ncbi:late cornified envelope protein 5A-like [Gracilinanus agilis]|uniref:late cornified envelope protein 5A-like n=1 Tax=Gracilinanus agilis TaxID=191870 RepID=UPI001CFCEB95|nr:late cornified envelope protein 5A-like [Gracilinanus agilis]
MSSQHEPPPKGQTSKDLPKCPPQASAPVLSYCSSNTRGYYKFSSEGPYSPFSQWRRKSIRRRVQSSDYKGSVNGQSQKSAECGGCCGSYGGFSQPTRAALKE